MTFFSRNSILKGHFTGYLFKQIKAKLVKEHWYKRYKMKTLVKKKMKAGLLISDKVDFRTRNLPGLKRSIVQQ